MGADLAITAGSTGTTQLNNFNDVVMAKMELPGDGGKWILMGRVYLTNFDGDPQWVTASLLHDRNVVIDQVRLWIPGEEYRQCFYLQAGFVANGKETVTLECNTWKGEANDGSLIAIKVDNIDFQ
jgi:hypothetical protein